MAKQREGREAEFFKGIIRQQKAEIKRLKRRIRELEKDSLYLTQEESEDLIEEITERKDCPKCNEGNFTTFEFNNRAFLVCDKCKFRVKVL
jgi:ribosomal protein S27AE